MCRWARHGFAKSLYTKKGFAWYQRLAEIVHREGCKLCAQLHQSDSNLKAMLKYIPGRAHRTQITMEELRPLLNEQVGPYITGLPAAQGARRSPTPLARRRCWPGKAGFDMVQIHGDRMCGSFSSGSVQPPHRCATAAAPENRARFAVEAVRAVRQPFAGACPSTTNWLSGRRTPTTATPACWKAKLGIFVPLLVEAGVTSFHVTLANHSSLGRIPSRPPTHPYFKGGGLLPEVLR